MNAEKPDIVVVDDNLDNLRILSDMLRNHGYTPRPAASGTLALDAVKASPPVLILLDIMMPETDGFEVCRQLKSGNKTRDIPVIFITALDQLENKVRAFAAGGVDYITKPFQEAEVMARINTHVGLRAKEHLRETEARMQKLQKYESLVRMAGAVAHRFNNDLQAVLGNLEMAVTDCTSEGSTPQTLTAAMRSAEKAAGISRLMVTYTGKIRGDKEQMDLGRWCQDNLAEINALMGSHPVIDFRWRHPGPVISADAGQIRQMVTALLQNAREATGKNKTTIALSIDTVSPDAILQQNRFPVDWVPENRQYACIRVKDAGCGIAETDMEKIFDPFFTTHFTGRGLGLSLVLGIAMAHAGSVTVESRPAAGSTFQVYLPAAREPKD
jgi:signal transduction histidine kinase